MFWRESSNKQFLISYDSRELLTLLTQNPSFDSAVRSQVFYILVMQAFKMHFNNILSCVVICKLFHLQSVPVDSILLGSVIMRTGCRNEG